MFVFVTGRRLSNHRLFISLSRHGSICLRSHPSLIDPCFYHLTSSHACMQAPRGTHMPQVAGLCLWYCIWCSVSVGRTVGGICLSSPSPSGCLDVRCVFHTCPCVCVCWRACVRRLGWLACLSPHLPFTHLFKHQSKMGNMKLGPHFSFWLVPPPCDPLRDTSPVTINTHFLGLTAKNRMFVVCCNWPSLEC